MSSNPSTYKYKYLKYKNKYLNNVKGGAEQNIQPIICTDGEGIQYKFLDSRGENVPGYISYDDPSNIVTISSNQFTLGAGTYIIEFSCPSYMSQQNKAQLYDVTNSTAIANSISVYAQASTYVATVASGCGRVSITGNTTYKLRHYISTAKVSNGLGVALGVSSTGNNVYSQVKITKLL